MLINRDRGNYSFWKCDELMILIKVRGCTIMCFRWNVLSRITFHLKSLRVPVCLLSRQHSNANEFISTQVVSTLYWRLACYECWRRGGLQLAGDVYLLYIYNFYICICVIYLRSWSLQLCRILNAVQNLQECVPYCTRTLYSYIVYCCSRHQVPRTRRVTSQYLIHSLRECIKYKVADRGELFRWPYL